MNTDEETMQVQGSNEQEFSTPPSKKMNRSLSSVGISPVSLHALPPHRRVSSANEKFSKVADKFKAGLAEAFDIDPEKIKDKTHQNDTKKRNICKS